MVLILVKVEPRASSVEGLKGVRRSAARFN
jgi:hypothetical protein